MAMSSQNLQLTQCSRRFIENHGLQCGFCTPGMVMSAIELVTKNKTLSLSVKSGKD